MFKDHREHKAIIRLFKFLTRVSPRMCTHDPLAILKQTRLAAEALGVSHYVSRNDGLLENADSQDASLSSYNDAGRCISALSV